MPLILTELSIYSLVSVLRPGSVITAVTAWKQPPLDIVSRGDSPVRVRTF